MRQILCYNLFMFDLSVIDVKTMQLITILVISIVFWVLLQLFTKPLINNLSTGTPRGRRLRTLSNVVRPVISTMILVFAVFESLSVLGIDLAPLVAAAGVTGIAVGFGAQSLVKDVISGFFLLVEDQLDEGDEVEISGKRGVVKKISIRTIWLTEEDGTIDIIPSGSIVVVTNFSRTKIKKKSKKVDKK